MNTLIEDFDKNVFAEILLVNLHKFGFGTLSKSDLEALLYYSLVQSNMKINCSTSYEKAELLMITDSKLTGLRKRSGIWLDKERDSDDKILERFLGKCIQFYLKMPYESNIKVVIDDEMDRRSIQKALEKLKNKGIDGIPVDISLNGRSLILKASYLDAVLVSSEPYVNDEFLKKILKEKRISDLRRYVLDSTKEVSFKILETLIEASIKCIQY